MANGPFYRVHSVTELGRIRLMATRMDILLTQKLKELPDDNREQKIFQQAFGGNQRVLSVLLQAEEEGIVDSVALKSQWFGPASKSDRKVWPSIECYKSILRHGDTNNMMPYQAIAKVIVAQNKVNGVHDVLGNFLGLTLPGPSCRG